MKIGALDPGKNGGLCIYDTSIGTLKLFTVPNIGTSTDYQEFARIIEAECKDVDRMYIEEVHSIFGASAKSNFEFGYINGFLVGVLNTLRLSYHLIQPKKWQKEVWAIRDIVKNAKGKTDTKASSLLAAKRIFPNEDFMATSRSRVPHDGLVDASLLAYYGSKN